MPTSSSFSKPRPSSARPLIVVFTSLTLATLISYAATQLSESTKAIAASTAPTLPVTNASRDLAGTDINLTKDKVVSAPQDQPQSPSSEESKRLAIQKEFREIAAKAEAGDLDAMFQRSMAHLVGIGTPIDLPQAAKWLRMAAEKGHTQSQFSYGQACLRGEIRPKDVNEAIRWFRLSADKQNPDAELCLAHAYAAGEGVLADDKESRRWLKLSALHGHPIAQSDYAFAILDENNPATCEEAADWLRKSALQGNAKAMFNLAIMYQRGLGLPRDRITAFAWFMVSDLDGDEAIHEEVKEVLAHSTPTERRKATALTKGIIDKMDIAPIYSLGSQNIKAFNEFHKFFELAQQGKAEDQFELARRYHQGLGTAKNPAEAARWCRKAAEQGHVPAMRTLAACLEDGDGVAQDLVEMAKWYRRAAEQNDSEAQYRMGACYFYGNGVEKDLRQAEEWTRKAAEQGHPSAQSNLGGYLISGEDKSRHAEAIAWLKKSAKQGHPFGMYKYGSLVMDGRGVAADRIEGAAWLIACLERASDDKLEVFIEKQLKTLTPEERTKAEAAAIEIKKTL